MFELAAYSLAGAGLAAGALLLWRIPECGTATHDHVSTVSIIIPARNEERALPALLRSIRETNAFTGDIVVVDDHSADNTAAIARSFGARVISSAPVPSGWTGKTWACSQGAEQSAGEGLVFLDADTVILPGGLNRMLGALDAAQGVVSIAPYHLTERLYEQGSAVFNILMLGSVDAFSVFGRNGQPSGLFGPCLITRRADYNAVGGHASVKGHILEHLHIAEQFRKHGIGMACYGGRGVLDYRMYPEGIVQLVQGWSKAFVSGARHTKRSTVALISLWFAGMIAVTVSVFAGAVRGDPVFLAVVLLLYGCVVAEFRWMLARIGSFFVMTALLFPLPVAFFLVVFIRAMMRSSSGAGVTWKGRTLPA